VASVIDSLVVELGFDTKGALKGRKELEDIFKKLREDGERSGKGLEESAKRADVMISKLRDSVLDLFVVFTGGRAIKDFVKDLTDSDAAVGRLSRSTETAVSQITELEGIASISGGTVDGMAATIQNLQSAAQQLALTGQSSTLPYLRALGVQLKFNAHGALDVKDELLQLAAAGQRVGGGARAAELFRGAGVTDEGTINLLLQGTDAIKRYTDAIDEAGHATKEDVGAATDRQQAFRIFNASLETLGRTILTILTPAIVGVTKFLTWLIQAIKNSPALMFAATVAATILAGAFVVLSAALGTSYLLGALGRASTALKLLNATMLGQLIPTVTGFIRLIAVGFAGAISKLLLNLAVLTAEALPALAEAFLALGAAIELTPVGWFLTIVAALGFAAYELIQHWSSVKDFFKSMWDDIAGFFISGAEKIGRIPGVKWAMKKLGFAPDETPGPKSAPSAPRKAAATAPAAPQRGGSPASGTDGAESAINAVLRREDSRLSGKVTSDSGGVTKYGISSNSHPGLDVANLSLEDAKTIYRHEYWDAIGGSKLPAGLQATALDAAVNQGVDNAKKWIVASGGDPKKFNALRRGQYEFLATANPHKYGKYLKGWLSRVPSDTSSAVSAAAAGSAATAPGVGAGTSARAAQQTNSSNTTHSTEISIGNLNVQTKATDAKGIAQDIVPRLKQAAMASQSQSGAN